MPTTVKLLQNVLDYCAVKNNVIAKNISNVGTENYKREDVVFKDVLNENVSSILKTSNSRHISTFNMDQSESKFEHIYDESATKDSGINNVDIDQEMSELAENTLRFKFASKKVGEYYRNIQNVIKGGGKF